MTTLKRWWHWWCGCESWRVKYSDGARTRRLRYSEAANLAGVWDGSTVEFDP